MIENEMSVMLIISNPAGNPFPRATNALMVWLLNVSYPKPI